MYIAIHCLPACLIYCKKNSFFNGGFQSKKTLYVNLKQRSLNNMLMFFFFYIIACAFCLLSIFRALTPVQCNANFKQFSTFCQAIMGNISYNTTQNLVSGKVFANLFLPQGSWTLYTAEKRRTATLRVHEMFIVAEKVNLNSLCLFQQDVDLQLILR